jgi:hypothetical protein
LEAASIRRADSRSATALVLLLALLVGILALCFNRIHNGDLYLQLATGRFISQHGFVWTDPFPTIAQGQPWANQQWLSELLFYKLAGSIGMTGLTVFYAFVLGLPLLGLLWCCRRKEVWLIVAGAALYFPVLLSIIHPRAAAFSLLAFSVLVLLLLRVTSSGRAPGWLLVAVPALFVVWANLHGGLVGGLFLIALVATGLALDHWRKHPESVGIRQIGLLGLVGVLAFAATFGTPLGPGLWSYVGSFSNPALSLGTKEWGPALDSLPVLAYVAVAAAFAGWLSLRRPPGASVTPLLVTAGFLAATVFSMRNMIFIAPALFFLIAQSRDRTEPISLKPALMVGAAALLAAIVWLTALGPARSGAYLRSGPAEYALRHPPKHGRIASLGGVSSYLLWRAPHTPVLINGWLEHFTPEALRANYGAVRARPGRAPDASRWEIGAVITRHRSAIAALRSQGFVVKYVTPEGIYLVRETRRARQRRR